MRWKQSVVSFASRDHPALIAAARHGLPGLPAFDGPPATIDANDAEPIRIFARTDRISGLLAGAVRSGEVVFTSDADAHLESIDDDWHTALHACVLIEALLVRLADRLAPTGVRWRVTKGAAVAHLDYPEPTLRNFADIDLVVHADDWEAILDAVPVDRSGRTRALAFAHRFGKGATAMVDGMEIDLHLRFALGRFATRNRLAECFDTAEPFELAGRTISALTAEFRLLHACHHAVLGGEAELRAFRDVAQMALTSPAAMERAWDVARSWGVEAVVAAAVTEAWRRLRLPMSHPVALAAEGIVIHGADRRALEVFARRASFRRQALTSLGALPLWQRPGFIHSAWRMSMEHGS